MTSPTTAQLRAWARAQGMEVGDRGRLSPAVLEAYAAAHAAPDAAPDPAPPAPGPDVEQRFADLERQVGELARRVAQLERGTQAPPKRRRFGRRDERG